MKNAKPSSQGKITGYTIHPDWREALRDIAGLPEVSAVSVKPYVSADNSSETLTVHDIKDDGFTLIATADQVRQEIVVKTPYPEAVVDLLRKRRLVDRAADRSRDRGNSRSGGKRTSEVRDADALADRLSPELLQKLREAATVQEPEPVKPDPSARSGRKNARPLNRNQIPRSTRDADELSFEEYVDARDDASFEELLKQSELDWKKFK